MSIWTYKRTLTFRVSERWSGWFCERCCWSVPVPASRSDRDELAKKIEQLFERHSCARFARENWKPSG